MVIQLKKTRTDLLCFIKFIHNKEDTLMNLDSSLLSGNKNEKNIQIFSEKGKFKKCFF